MTYIIVSLLSAAGLFIGMIRIDAVDQVLIDLRQSMR